MGWLAFVLLVFFLEETYPPQILVGKAAELRRKTLNWGIHAKQEEIEVDLKELIVRNVSRPLRILFTEPIVLLISIYMSFVCKYCTSALKVKTLIESDGILYAFLTAYSLVFEGKYHFSPGISGLTYFGLVVGVAIGFVKKADGSTALAAVVGYVVIAAVFETMSPIVLAGRVDQSGDQVVAVGPRDGAQHPPLLGER